MPDPLGGGGFLWLDKVTDWLWAAVGGFAALIWKLLGHRIKKVETTAEAALPKADFEKARAESIGDRQHIRDDVKELFGKVESTKDLVNERVEAARERMSAELRELRTDMNGGFNAIREELRSWRK